MVERALRPCPFCAEIPSVEVEGEEMPRELQDTVDDLMVLVAASKARAERATDLEEIKRHHIAAGCARDGARLIRVLYRKLNPEGEGAREVFEEGWLAKSDAYPDYTVEEAWLKYAALAAQPAAGPEGEAPK